MIATSHGRTWGVLCLLQSKGTQSQAVVGPAPDLRVPSLFSDGSNVVFCFNSFTVFMSFIVSFLKSFLDL